MQYPLPECIGNPELLAGRAEEFRLLDKWIANSAATSQGASVAINWGKQVGKIV